MRSLSCVSLALLALGCGATPTSIGSSGGSPSASSSTVQPTSGMTDAPASDEDEDGTPGYRPRAIGESARMHTAWGEPLARGVKARLGSSRLIGDFSVVVAGPDGSFVSAAPYYSGLQKWDAGSGALVATSPLVSEVSFNVATTSADRKVGAFADFKSVTLIDLATLKTLRSFEVFSDSSGRIEGLAFLDDGKLLVGGCTKDPSLALRVFDTGGSQLRSLPVPAPKESYDEACAGPLVARAGWIGAAINKKARLLSQRDGKPRGEFESGVSVEAVALSADGSRFFVGGYGSAVNAFDTKTLKPVRSYGYFAYDTDRQIRGLALSPDETTLAVSASTVRLYDVATGLERTRLGVGVEGAVNMGHAFASQGDVLAFPMDHPALIGRFDWKTGAQRGPHDLGRHDDTVDHVITTPSGAHFSSSRDGSIRAWRADGSPLATLTPFAAPAPIALGPDGALLVLGAESRSVAGVARPSCNVTLHNPETLAHRDTIELDASDDVEACWASALAAKPGGELAYALFAKRLVAFQPRTKKVIASVVVEGRNGELVPLSDGTLAVRVRGRWELFDGGSLAKLRELELREAAFSAAADAMIGAQRESEDKLVLLDLKTGKPTRTVDAPKGTRFSDALAVSSDGSVVYVGTSGDKVSGLLAIATKSGQVTGSLERLHTLGYPTSTSLSLSHDQKVLLEGNADGTALVIDVAAFGGAK